MSDKLSEIETRILGSLVEKQLTTPEYYPLTLNALIAACNQKTNRDPVVTYDEATVNRSLENLRDRNLVYVYYGSTSRVPKYKHMLPSVYDLGPAETALVCVMMLRGPQTLGELRERSGRLYGFRDLGEVQETLDAMIRRDEPVVTKLDRIPGQKEARFAHLLAGAVTAESYAAAHPPRAVQAEAAAERMTILETEVRDLRAEMESLKSTFEEFKKQFE